MLFAPPVKHILVGLVAASLTVGCTMNYFEGGGGADQNYGDGSGSGSGSGSGGGSGSGSGSNSGFVQATHASQPTVVSEGGTVLTAPKVVPIFFSGDSAMQTQVEAFLGQLTTSPYWTSISKEYGVGALSLGASIVSTDTPPVTDDALQAWITSHVGMDWPAEDGNTIYSVFLPAGVTLTASFGASCMAFGGYHEENASGAIVYALLPRCDDTIDTLTLALSHELLEASTDPHPNTAPAYNVVDNDDVIWEVTPGGELGDMCEYADGVRQRLVGNFLVQRTWSNQSAAAGHDPCVPAMAAPYVEAVPLVTDITVDFGGGQVIPTRGLSIPIGTTKVVEVDLYSDAPAADWTVEALDVGATYLGHPELSVALDKPTGGNGSKMQLTITRNVAGTQLGSFSEVELVSKVNAVTVGTWWLLVTP